MVLEQFLDRNFVVRHTFFLFLLSILYVFIAYAVQEIFFPEQSIATVLLLTILLVPSLHHLTVAEEKLERAGASKFFKRHKTLFKCYFGAFLGILVGFTALGAIYPDAISYQTQQLQYNHLKPEIITTFLQTYIPDVNVALSVFTHNLMYLILGFFLSIFYGAGAIFIITYNASFFAAFLLQLLAQFANSTTLAIISLSHLIPESAGFILTAMAGSSLSRAIIHEKLKDQHFRNVLKNDVKLLLAGILLVLVAAFIETYITAAAFHKLI